MKKKFRLGLIFSAIGLVFGTTSCKKDWVCQCTYDGATEDVITYPNTKKADAKKSCDAYEALIKVDYSDASCKIK